MKKIFAIALAALVLAPLAAQTDKAEKLAGTKPADYTLSTMSLNGMAGHFTVPTAKILRSDKAIGVAAGYGINFFGRDIEHLAKINLSLFNLFELGGTWDIKPEKNDDDFLMGLKFRLPLKKVNIAVGSSFDCNRIGGPGPHWGFQVYGAVTYAGTILSSVAETTLVVGKTFIEKEKVNSDIDFGMGFDVAIAPKYLKGFLHWVVDYSNFSYGTGAYNLGSSSVGIDLWRGILNTGVRLDLSHIPALQNWVFVVEAYMLDAFDHGSRGFGLGVTVGMGF